MLPERPDWKQVEATSQKFLWEMNAKTVIKRVFSLKLWVLWRPRGWASSVWRWLGRPFLVNPLKPEDASAWDGSEAMRQLQIWAAFYGLNSRALIPANLPEIASEAQRSPSAVATGLASSHFAINCPQCLSAGFIQKFSTRQSPRQTTTIRN